MIEVAKDAIMFKDSEGNMQSAGVLCNVGILSGENNSFPFNMTSGEITPTSDLTEMTVEIENKNGSKCMFFYMCDELYTTTVKGSEVGGFYCNIQNGVSTMIQIIQYRSRRNTTSGDLSFMNDSNLFDVSNNHITLKSYNTSHFFKAGYTYKWFFINLDSEV